MTTTAPTGTGPADRGAYGDRPAGPARSSFSIYSALTGLAAIAVLLQGLWAGIFLQHEGERSESWVEVHATGGEVAIALAAIATVFALWKLRSQKALWIGSLALTLLLVLESYLGGLIVDQHKDAVTIIHIPLAMALMALVVYLPFRAGRAARAGRV